jgi:hypothetical protein
MKQIEEHLRAEYVEMPGMSLKLEQVQRLCGIEPSMCNEALVEAKVLRVKSDGSYAKPQSRPELSSCGELR